MMKCFVPLLLCAASVFAQQSQPARGSERPANATPQEKKGTAATAVAENRIAVKMLESISSSRLSLIGETSSERLTHSALIAPGSPPILAFRYFDGQARHRFGELDLVMDDAGH